MLVSRYMTRKVVTIAPQTHFRMAYELMRQHKIHHLPVLAGARLVGIVAERDLLLAAAHFGSAEVPVAEIMRKPVVTVSDRATLAAAARILVRKHIGSLPVLGAGRVLAGIITETDVFKIMAGTARPTSRKAAPKRGTSKARRNSAPRRGAKTGRGRR